MCGKGDGNYTQRYLCGCTLDMLVIIVILSMVIKFGGESGASVEMSGKMSQHWLSKALASIWSQVWVQMMVMGGLGWKFYVLC